MEEEIGEREKKICKKGERETKKERKVLERKRKER